MGIGRILLSSQHFFHTPNSLQLPLNHPPCHPSTHTHLHTAPQGCFVHCWNVHVELCVQPPPNLHHAHCAKSQSPCICTLALEAPSCLVGALTMCPPPPINLQQHSALHLHLCAHSEPGCTATFGHAHCRRDISLVYNPPIGMSFGPWNISQSLPVKGATTNAFF